MADDPLEAAFAALVSALPVGERSDMRDSAARAASLWRTELLRGHELQLTDTLGERFPAAAGTGAIWLRGAGVHLVCPHHLTVAFGRCDLAYVPDKQIVGFGGLVRLAEAACARLVLQEEAGSDVVKTLVQELGAMAALCRIRAIHPCHNLTHPRSHDSEVVTLHHQGDSRSITVLTAAL